MKLIRHDVSKNYVETRGAAFNKGDADSQILKPDVEMLLIFIIIVVIHCESDDLQIPIAAADWNKRRNFVTQCLLKKVTISTSF